MYLILAEVGIDLRKPDQISVDHTGVDRIRLCNSTSSVGLGDQTHAALSR